MKFKKYDFMPNKKNIFFIFLGLFLLFSILFFRPQPVQMAASDNLSGWAWSENIGWISFNCADRNVCATSNYGVNIDSLTGNFSGYAWSENIGWIDFAPTAVPPGEASANPAKLNLSTNKIIGWARALATDASWDGWIKLSDDAKNYGIVRSGCELTNWAWGSDVIGWIEFKGVAQDNSPYAVKTTFCANTAPTVTAGSAVQPNYCAWPGNPIITFSWTFSDPDGNTQSAFQVQIDDNSDFSSPVNDSGKVTSDAQNYSASGLSWNTIYYWQVKVWDNGSPNLESSWAQGSSFAAPLHAYPTADFIWDPAKPHALENVKFIDQSTAYGGATIDMSKLSWIFQDAIPNSATATTSPTVQFQSDGSKIVSLTVFDSDGFTCSASKSVSIKKPLPKWKEVAPY